jgi:hypothetical protein
VQEEERMSRSYKRTQYERYEKITKRERRENTRQIRRQAHVELAGGEDVVIESKVTYHSDARDNFAEFDSTWRRK